VKPEHNQADALREGEGIPAELNSINKQLTELRSQISDLGFEMDSHKMGIAASMGAGVFMLLLGMIAGYDRLAGNARIWAPLGITPDFLLLIALGLGVAGLFLLIQGYIRQRRRDREPEVRLAELQRQYSRLLDHKDSLSQDQS
jgi:hypothetical protein